MTKGNVHLIEDENLGGLLREYVETDRKADVGDYAIKEEMIRKVTGYSDMFDNFINFETYKNSEGYDVRGWRHGSYKTLDPTDIIHYSENEAEIPTRYKLVDRKAEVGEKVIIVNAKKTERDRCPFDNGHISTVINTSEDSVKIKPFANIYDYEYRVLEPVDKAEIYVDGKKVAEMPLYVDESQASPEVIDMFGNLAQRIVRLEDEIDTLHSNQKRMAEELENATPAFGIDSAEVIVELAKLLARESRKVGR